MIRRPPRSTRVRSSAASDVYKRQPVLLSTMVTSRLLELVVHADDLVRSTRLVAPGDPGPLEAGAVTVVADALLDVLVDRGGWAVEVVDPIAWLRLALSLIHI